MRSYNSSAGGQIIVQQFLTICAALGPFIGVLIGSWLTMKIQRRLWILDNKRAEYRKLLSTLTDCASKFATIWGVQGVVQGPRDQREINNAARKSANVIFNRLFIAREMQQLNVLVRWKEAISQLQRTHDGPAFGISVGVITNEIRSAALKDFS